MVHPPAVILTASGETIDVSTPDPAVVDIRVIAHALSRICRWGGHTRKTPAHPFAIFSVAQHSLIVADTGTLGCPPELALIGLLHDAAEAYVGDIKRPLRPRFPEFKQLEHAWALAIGMRFGLGDQLANLPPVIKERDARALATERRDMMAPGKWKPEGEPFPYRVDYVAPEYAEEAFLHRFEQLTKGGV